MLELDYRAVTEKYRPGKVLDDIIVSILEEFYKLKREGLAAQIPTNFSTNISSAFILVDIMSKLTDGVLMLAAPQAAYAETEWRCTFSEKWWVETESPYSWDIKGESAPHAICIAFIYYHANEDLKKELEITF